MRWMIAACLGLFAFQPAHAFKYIPTSQAQCTSMNFQQVFPMKMRNQNNLGWCYAHAAADLLQYTYKLPIQVSAADIAINYSKSKWSRFVTFFTRIFSRELRKEPPQTGMIKNAVQMILPQGYCPESSLPSDEWTKVDPNTLASSKEEILQSVLDSYDLQNQVHRGVFRSADQLPWYFEFKNIDRDRFFLILKNSSKKTFLETLRKAACGGDRVPFPNHRIGIDFRFRTRHIFQEINAGFDRGTPPTIDFFSDVFYHYDSAKKDISTLHTVLLYGRRFDSEANECVYMIKNSYGANCDHVDSDTGLPYDPKLECEAGNIWLPESKMFPAITSRLILHR